MAKILTILYVLGYWAPSLTNTWINALLPTVESPESNKTVIMGFDMTFLLNIGTKSSTGLSN